LGLLLFGIYLIFFCWLVTRIKFFSKGGFSKTQVIILFLIKVMAGILYGWTGVYYANLAQVIDTWTYHYQGLDEMHLLQTHPVKFFTSLVDNYHTESFVHFLSSKNSWWNDLKANFLIKLFAIFDLFSFGQYYINVIFYNFLTLFGPIALYRAYRDHYSVNRVGVLVGTFFLPSFLYWTSGLHKEGLIFTGLGLLVFACYFALKDKRLTLQRVVLIALGLVLLLILRNFLIFPLLAAMVAWYIASRVKPANVLRSFFIIYLFFFALFFCSGLISPRIDLPNAVVVKQQEFTELKGGVSAIPVKTLQPTLISFLTNLPQAFTLSTLRPYPSDVHNTLSLAACIEVYLLLFLFLFYLFYPITHRPYRPLPLFCIFFSSTVLLTIGYSVNILGAIVRYRSIVMPFLIVPLLASIDWQRIFRKLPTNIIKTDNV
jgi:hypothetical protein